MTTALIPSAPLAPRFDYDAEHPIDVTDIWTLIVEQQQHEAAIKYHDEQRKRLKAQIAAFLGDANLGMFRDEPVVSYRYTSNFKSDKLAKAAPGLLNAYTKTEEQTVVDRAGILDYLSFADDVRRVAQTRAMLFPRVLPDQMIPAVPAFPAAPSALWTPGQP